jgi:hypothetical protein
MIPVLACHQLFCAPCAWASARNPKQLEARMTIVPVHHHSASGSLMQQSNLREQKKFPF